MLGYWGRALVKLFGGIGRPSTKAAGRLRHPAAVRLSRYNSRIPQVGAKCNRNHLHPFIACSRVAAWGHGVNMNLWQALGCRTPQRGLPLAGKRGRVGYPVAHNRQNASKRKNLLGGVFLHQGDSVWGKVLSRRGTARPLPAADVDVARPGYRRDVLNGEVAPRCLGNVRLIGSGHGAGQSLAWLLLLFWRGELYCVKADRFQSWDVGNSRAGLQCVSPWCPVGRVFACEPRMTQSRF
jgi:hypothetical protein